MMPAMGSLNPLEKGRACESYGAEVQQYTVGPEVFTYVILKLLDDLGYFSASLYLPLASPESRPSAQRSWSRRKRRLDASRMSSW